MNDVWKVQNLVVDTSAFIRNAPLQDIGVKIITEEDVVHEVKNKRQLRRLVALPYDLSIQTADPENIKFVTEFAKKTGDYFSLSATDIKVIALTYQLEKAKVGTLHLRTKPIVSGIVSTNPKKSKSPNESLAGFYVPGTKKDTDEKSSERSNLKKTEQYLNNGNNTESKTEDMSAKRKELTTGLKDFVVRDKFNIEHNVGELTPLTVEELWKKIKVYECSDYEEDDNDDQNDDDSDDQNDDDSGWITPGNICNVKKELDSDILERKPAIVACLTIDFAMQNVLKQIGLKVVALDGKVIKQMRTFILRCYACYNTTSIMTKVFCPSCGNKTLKKVSVSLDENGKQIIHINFRRPISKKGKRFSLPMPKGGKHANNPILCEDQPIPDQRPTRLARTKNDPLQDDYIAGYSPFIMRDVYSKSAMLRSGGSIKYWMSKNPNEVRRRKK